jgi:hypothetical protein
MELVQAINTATRPLVIKLDNDIQLSSSLNITTKRDITLTSNNRTIGFFKLIGAKYDSTIVVEKDGLLMLRGIIVTHAQGNLGRGVNVKPGGALVMVDGEISGNKGYYGGGVFNQGSFTMSGGKISGNGVYSHASSRGTDLSSKGGGVYNEGVFVMSRGKIYSNVAYRGGGVYNDGAFSMSGGVISGNIADIDRDIYTSPGGTFDKNGGVIFGYTDIITAVICVSIILGVTAFLFFKKIDKHKGKKFIQNIA